MKVLMSGQLERMLEDEPEGLSPAEIAQRAGAAQRQVGDLLGEPAATDRADVAPSDEAQVVAEMA